LKVVEVAAVDGETSVAVVSELGVADIVVIPVAGTGLAVVEAG
jgi:hypothetical protein